MFYPDVKVVLQLHIGTLYPCVNVNFYSNFIKLSFRLSLRLKHVYMYFSIKEIKLYIT